MGWEGFSLRQVVLGNRLAGCDVCPDRAEHEQDTQTAEKHYFLCVHPNDPPVILHAGS